MIAAFTAALRRMLRRPLRSILTVLEVALGALAVTLALNLTQGRQLAALPPDVFRVITGDRSDTTATVFNVIQTDDLDKLRKLIPDALVVEMYADAWGSILEYKGERYRLLGGARVNPGHIGVATIEMLYGTFLSRNDIKAGTPPMVISQSVAKQVFQEESPLGKTVQVALGYAPPGLSPSFETYRVVGVFRDPADGRFGGSYAYWPLKNSSGMDGMPIALNVKAKPGSSKIAQVQALDAVRQVYKDSSMFNQFKKAVYATTSSSYVGDGPIADPQVLLFSGFAIIMLITCSIGIFSIQLVDITERTKEIGMRRALGATRSMIVLESLASAFVLAGVGAVIGVLIAAPLLPVIKNMTGPFLFSRGLEFSPFVALQVIALVLVVGVLLGLYPALLASRLRPVEALREM